FLLGVVARRQEYEEEGRVCMRGDGDPVLYDHDGGEQGRGDRPQTDAAEGELADVVPDAEREEDRDFRVATQRRSEPVKHLVLPPQRACRSGWPARPA